MKLAYFDCHSGISVDMILGALVDLGVDLKILRRGLASLGLKGFQIKSSKVARGMVSGTKIDVIESPRSRQVHSRSLNTIKKMISGSKLPKEVITHSVGIFERLGRAEAKVHNTRVSKIHFHEVGAIDSIVDIVGGSYALHLLGVDRIVSSPLNTGQGTVECEHGILPVPAPATLELLKGIPGYSSGVEKELTTPTGAAMIGYWACEFGPMPMMSIQATGYGAGTHRLPNMVNMLRIIVGTTPDEKGQRVCQIETNIDDMNPEFYEPVMDLLFSAGALDVFLTPIFMKKNRPAVKLSVLGPVDKKEVLSRLILMETTSFGVRTCELDRNVLERERIPVKTRWGRVHVKVGRLEGKVVHVSPEYEDCRKLASKAKIPLKTLYEEVRKIALENFKLK